VLAWRGTGDPLSWPRPPAALHTATAAAMRALAGVTGTFLRLADPS
jgi:hypothetical protein